MWTKLVAVVKKHAHISFTPRSRGRWRSKAEDLWLQESGSVLLISGLAGV